MPTSYSDRNAVPSVVRQIPAMTVANGAVIDFNIAYALAGGSADPLLNPRFTLIAPAGIDVDEVTGQVLGNLQDDTAHDVTVGVVNDLGPEVTQSFTITTGSVIPTAPPGEATGASAVNAIPSGSNIVVSHSLPDTGVTARQWQRRVWAIGNATEDGWANIGSQAATATTYTDTPPSTDVAYEYRIVETIASAAAPSGTDVAWVAASAVARVKSSGVITITDGPQVVTFTDATGVLTLTLDGTPIITNQRFSVNVGGSNVIDPVAADSVIDPVFADSNVVGIHFEFAPNFQRWLDLKFFDGKPLILGHSISRTNHKDNPFRTYSDSQWDTFEITNSRVALDVSGITSAANEWLQRDSFEGVDSADGSKVRAGAIHRASDGTLTDQGTTRGGTILAAIVTANGIPSAYVQNNSSPQHHRDYLDFEFAQATTVDELVMDYGEPESTDRTYSQNLNTVDFDVTHSGGTVTRVTSAAQVSGGAIGQLIGGPYTGVTKVRMFGSHASYGQRTLFGAIRGLVGATEVAKAAIQYLPNDVVNVDPFCFAMRDFHRNTPAKMFNTSSQVGVEVAYPVAGHPNYKSGAPSCGPIIEFAFAVGTAGASYAFNQPAQAAQFPKMPDKLHPFITSGVSTAADAVIANCISGIQSYHDSEGDIFNWLAHGDTKNGSSNRDGMIQYSQAAQAGTIENALTLWQHTQTEANWTNFKRQLDFGSKATTLDYIMRNTELGTHVRKGERSRDLYMDGGPQDGYRHDGIAFAAAADLTGFRYYDDAARRICDGALIRIDRDTPRNYFSGSFSRDQALLLRSALVAYGRWGDIHPVFDGAAPTNTAASPNDSTIPSGDTILDVLARMWDAQYSGIINSGSTLKYMGAGVRSDLGSLCQPIWMAWSMSSYCAYHDVLVATSDTARASQVLQVIGDTAAKYDNDFVKPHSEVYTSSTSSDTVFAYRCTVAATPNTDPLTASDWTEDYESAQYGSYVAELFALAGEKLSNASYTTKAEALWDEFVTEYQTELYTQRFVSGAVFGLPNLVRTIGASL